MPFPRIWPVSSPTPFLCYSPWQWLIGSLWEQPESNMTLAVLHFGWKTCLALAVGSRRILLSLSSMKISFHVKLPVEASPQNHVPNSSAFASKVRGGKNCIRKLDQLTKFANRLTAFTVIRFWANAAFSIDCEVRIAFDQSYWINLYPSKRMLSTQSYHIRSWHITLGWSETGNGVRRGAGLVK